MLFSLILGTAKNLSVFLGERLPLACNSALLNAFRNCGIKSVLPNLRLPLLISIMAGLSMAQTPDIKILKEGNGEPVKKGQLVQVHYTGWLADTVKADTSKADSASVGAATAGAKSDSIIAGEKFDSSLDRGEALEFILGAGHVIKGWDIGIEGMKIGETRRLLIPSKYAYGDKSLGPIPANADLLFEVELVDAQKPLSPDTLPAPNKLKWKTIAPGLEIFDEKIGDGAVLHAGMELKFHYTGWLANGHKFGSSKDLGKPATVLLGIGKLVRGLEIGLESVKQGGARWFRLSPSMAYGPTAMASIPANSTLIFRIQADGVSFDEELASSMDFFPNVSAVNWKDGADGLKFFVEKEGDGEPVESGQAIKVHYTGWLTDGTKFDSSRERGEPITLELGAGRVIRGWDIGLEGMRPGEKRLLMIPPNLGYGASGGGPIPPNATLIFAVEIQ